MRKIRYFLHPLTLSLALVYFQVNFFMPSFFSAPHNFMSYFMISAVFLGVLFGLMGCPACLLPLTMSLSSCHNHPKKTMLPVFIFNMMRLLSVFLYSLSISLSFAFVKKIIYPRYFLIINGLIMIVFSFIVLRRIYFRGRAPFLREVKIKNMLWLYGVWGFVLGFPCGMEATGFLVYLNSYSATVFSRIIAMLLFSVFSILPVVILIFVLYLGFKKINSLWSNFNVYLRNLAFFYLLFMGIIFIVMSFS